MTWLKKILVWLAFTLLVFGVLAVGVLLGWSEDTLLLVTGSVVAAGLVIFVYRRVSSLLPVVALTLLWLILALGILLDLPNEPQVACIGLVLAVVGAIWVYRWIQDRRSAARMEQVLADKAQGSDGSEDLDRFARELEVAIKSLKTQSPEELKTPYSLPWYMVVGPPGVGKTSAITHSGLGITREVVGTGESRNSGCDIKVHQTAVLVDTVGRYMVQEEAVEEWHTLLKTLEKHHRYKPINGVLLCLSLADLAESNEDGNPQCDPIRLRARLSEMMQYLGVSCPIYLVFTKCDLLLGFQEFFQDLEPHQRNQLWGSTINREDLASSDAQTIFTRNFDRLLKALDQRLLVRLGGEIEDTEKSTLYLFPQEFAAYRDRLADFVDELFWPHAYQQDPIFRGFYFVSGAQEGQPLGRVLSSYIHQFDPEADSSALISTLNQSREDPSQGKKGFFLRDLLSDVVVRDYKIVVRTKNALWRAWCRQLALGAAALALLVGFGGSVSKAYDTNVAQLEAIGEDAKMVQLVELRTPTEFPSDFSHLDRLRQRLVELEDPPFFSWGLYRSGQLREDLRVLYDQKIDLLVKRYIVGAVEEKLRRSLKEPGADEEIYAYLKAYLLLGPQRERLGSGLTRLMLEEISIDGMDGTPAFLKKQLVLALEEVYFSTRETEAVQRLRLQSHALISTWISRFVRDEGPEFSLDADLIAAIRSQLYQTPTIASIYSRLIKTGIERLPYVTLNQILSGEAASVFRADYEVPGLFTVKGWRTYVRDAIEQESVVPSQEDWVLGKTAANLPLSLRDPDELALALHALYFEEYVLHWQRLIDDTVYRPISSDLMETSLFLQQLGDPSTSALVALMDGLTAQTRFQVDWEGQNEEEENQDSVEEEGPDSKKIVKMVKKYLKLVGIKPPKPPKMVKAIGKDVKKSMKGSKGGKDAGDDGQGVAQTFELLRDTPEFYVDLYFADLHSLSILPPPPEGEGGVAAPAPVEQDGPPPVMVELLNHFAGLGVVLEGLVDESGLKARDHAVAVLEQTAVELPEALKILSEASALSKVPREQLLEFPVLKAWDAVIAVTQTYLNTRWNEVVYNEYRTFIESSYPFDIDGAQDVPIEDLAKFFAPQSGTLWSFVQAEMEPLIDVRSWEGYDWQGRGVKVSSQLVQSLNRAEQLTQNLFREGQLSVPFRLKPDLPAAQGADGKTVVLAQVCLAIDGEESCYKMGPPEWGDYSWPNSDGILGASLEVLTRETSLSELEFEGPWGWFRLLQAADMPKGQSRSLFPIEWTLPCEGGGSAEIKYHLQAPSANNPFAAFNDFFSFECPASLN